MLWFKTQKFLTLIKSDSFFLKLLMSNLKVHCQVQDHNSFYLASFKSFSVSIFTIRSLINLGLISVYILWLIVWIYLILYANLSRLRYPNSRWTVTSRWIPESVQVKFLKKQQQHPTPRWKNSYRTSPRQTVCTCPTGGEPAIDIR